MAELGLALGADGMPGMEEIHYTLGPDGQYQPVLTTHPAHPHGHPTELGDQPFPQGHTGGQTFASTLLLSFSCSPLLKQHLLRTLHMTNEELASLEPILSAAWDQWDHAVRLTVFLNNHPDSDRLIIDRIYLSLSSVAFTTQNRQQKLNKME